MNESRLTIPLPLHLKSLQFHQYTHYSTMKQITENLTRSLIKLFELLMGMLNLRLALSRLQLSTSFGI